MTTRGAAVMAAAVIAARLAGAGAWAEETADAVSSARGAALFDGREAMGGAIREHERPLPPELAACGNCHARGDAAVSAGPPPLNAAWLTTPRVRRNGPPSAYADDTFCRALRGGVDPVNVMLSRAMPVFAASDTQCASLWRFLTAGDGAE